MGKGKGGNRVTERERMRGKGEGRGDFFVISLQILWCFMLGFSCATYVKMYACY
jgi:hypothetical protein